MQAISLQGRTRRTPLWVEITLEGRPFNGLAATLVHTAGYLAATAAIALVVYGKLGLALLRRAWVNLDLAVAWMVTGCATFLV